MKIFVPKEDSNIENRVAITPDILKKFQALGFEIHIESGAGNAAGYSDEEYDSNGANICETCDDYDILVSIEPKQHKDHIKEGTTVIGLIDPFYNDQFIIELNSKRITTFALDFIARTSRAQYMDVLSSQANLAGYRAVIEAAHMINRAFPLMMTTAGTVPAAKVLVIGAGVAGLQAIATAKRLGCVVSAFDVRKSAKEQVESLGAKFVEVESNETTDGVYAKEMSAEYQKAQEEKLREVISKQDVIITTAQIPGKRAPLIIKKDMLDLMRRNSLIIDLASKTGGNCEITEHGKTVDHNGVKIISFENILNQIPYDASRLFSKNVFSFVENLKKHLDSAKELLDTDDEIIRSTLITHNGQTVNERLKGAV